MTRGRRAGGALLRAVRVGQAALWLPVGHLIALTIAGSGPVRPPTPRATPGTRFVVLIPGRNESAVVTTAVQSVLAAHYPAGLLRVIVIADNCDDDTAAVAMAAGAEVWERHDSSRPSKGAALEWAFGRLLSIGNWDALVVVDADSAVDADLLRVLDSRLQEAPVIQAERRVLNADENLLTRLSVVSSGVQTVLRPRGRERYGATAKLVGTGMTFHRDVLERVPWQAGGLVEDLEYWLSLMEHGIRPVFEPAARVADLMPATPEAAQRQRERWATGRADVIRQHAWRALGAGLRRRDWFQVEAVVSELLLPTLSTTGALVAGTGLLGRLLGGRRTTVVASVQAAALAAHVVAGLRASEASPATYRALAAAPSAVAWKIVLMLRSKLRKPTLVWQGTRS